MNESSFPMLPSRTGHVESNKNELNHPFAPARVLEGDAHLAATSCASTAKPSVMMVCSSGGHLDQLLRLEPWWHDLDRTWVTFDLPDAVSRLEGERTYWAHHPTTRNVKNLLRNMALARRLIKVNRPDIVISTGAAVAYPFFLAAKAYGAKTVFLEVYDRVTTPTLTGRLCRPISDSFLVQWPSQQDLYPNSTFIGSVYP